MMPLCGQIRSISAQERCLARTQKTGDEADQLQDFIHKQHLNAFMSMLSTTEVFGKGFNHA